MSTRNSPVSLSPNSTPWLNATDGGPRGTILVAAMVANGNTAWLNLDGYKTIYLEIIETAGGTGTVTVQGTLNQYNIYTLATAPVGGAAITYTGTVAVTANQAIYYTVRDLAPLVRVNLAGVAGGGSINVNVYALPI
jgi:hypothetical protein